jgi:pimeloyl-ACP methyl ester carboxylesterase
MKKTLLLAATIVLPLSAHAADTILTDGPLTIARQGSFFVGGRELKSDALSTVPAFGATGTITVDQMYVRYEIPTQPKDHAVVLIHGCCLTGKSWETTPDGRMGWDEYFLRRGFSTYVVDQAWRGRSAASPVAMNMVKTGKAAPDSLPAFISAGREVAWTVFRFGGEYPKVFEGLQFPLEAQEEFWKQMVPDWNYGMTPPVPTVKALSELSQRLGKVVLISHSQSGIFPFQTATLSPKGIAGIISIEPGTCPAANYDMTALKGIPVLVLFGDFVSQSEVWSKRLAGCKEFAAAAKTAGLEVDVIELPSVGMHGNSHMLMQDKNNLQVADWLAGWITANVK